MESKEDLKDLAEDPKDDWYDPEQCLTSPDCFMTHVLEQIKLSDKFYQLECEAYLQLLIDTAMAQASKTIRTWREVYGPRQAEKVENFVKRYQNDLLDSIQKIRETVLSTEESFTRKYLIERYGWHDMTTEGSLEPEEFYEQREADEADCPTDNNSQRIEEIKQHMRVLLARQVKAEFVNTISLKLEQSSKYHREYVGLTNSDGYCASNYERRLYGSQ